MRTSRRSITVTMAPPEWRKRCYDRRRSTLQLDPDHVRHADRSWWREFMGDRGRLHPGRRSRRDRQVAREMRCECGESMELRGLRVDRRCRRAGHVPELRGVPALSGLGGVLGRKSLFRTDPQPK